MGWLRLRQVCLVAPHIEACSRLVAGLLGLSECHRDPNVAAYGLANIIFPLGRTRFLEIVCPLRPGSETAAGRFLAASGGAGGYMLIFDCDDPAARVAQGAARGVRLAHHIDRPNYQGYQLHPKDCRAAFIEFNTTPGGEAADGPYWPAGEAWQAHVRTERVSRFAGVDILTRDAAGLACLWSSLLDVPPRVTREGIRLTVDEQVILIREAPGVARDRLDALNLSVADPVGMLDEARRLGLETREDRFRLAGVWMALSRAEGGAPAAR